MRSTACLALLLFACHQPDGPPEAPSPTIAEHAWLTQPLWDDGKSEVAFYDAWFDGSGGRRSFTAATQLTKHGFDRVRQTKADPGVPDLKWTLFFEYESGSEQLKQSFVTNFAQEDLSPMKVSANRFDWCSNQYRELAFLAGRQVHVLERSDDYGNTDDTIEYETLAYPTVAMPLVVRTVDFTLNKQVDFSVILIDGTYVDAMIELVGTEKITTAAREEDAEKIVVHYAHAIESTFGPTTDEVTYWRALDPARTLIQVRSNAGNFGMTLIESLRSAYWEENIYDRLTRVKVRP